MPINEDSHEPKTKRRHRYAKGSPNAIEYTPAPSRETLYGVYLHCRQNKGSERLAEGDFLGLVGETTEGLTDVERRRFLKLADGMLPHEIAKEEGCRREAVLCSVKNMIRKNEYCRISAAYGVLRSRINQYK